MRVGIAERIDRDARVEIEISGSVLADQAHALAPLESEWRSGVGPIQRGHNLSLWVRCWKLVLQMPHKNQKRAAIRSALEPFTYAFEVIQSQRFGPKSLI
jgi:hypothetical protein